jgi:hypothetical protein
MAYGSNPGSGFIEQPPRLLHSAADWYGQPATVQVRMGSQDAVILPVFNRTRLGDDSTNPFAVEDASGGAYVPPDESFISTSDSITSGVLAPQDNLNTLYPLNESGQPIVPLSQEQPLANIMAETPSQTVPLATALANAAGGGIAVSSAVKPGTPAYTALVQAGMTAAQIASAQTTASSPLVAAAPATQIVAGVSNTTLFIGAAIALMVLAGKKR